VSRASDSGEMLVDVAFDDLAQRQSRAPGLRAIEMGGDFAAMFTRYTPNRRARSRIANHRQFSEGPFSSTRLLITRQGSGRIRNGQLNHRKTAHLKPKLLSTIQAVLKMAIGLVALAIACWALASRYLPVNNDVVMFSAALSPYLMLCGPVAVVLLVLAGRWIFAIVALAVTVAALAVTVPLYLRSDVAHTEGVAVRVITANLRVGRADPGQLVRSAEAQADVLAFQELTPREVDHLSAAGLDAIFPYRWLDPRRGASGVGLWSRFPMYATRRIDGYSMAFVSARIRVPGSSIDPSVLVAHLPGPWPQPIDDWRRDIDRLPATLDQVAEGAGGGAVVVAGDLNSTMDMRPFRSLLRNGYRDAAEQSGAGIKPTFPADWRLPPFIAIDHVLTRGCTATSLRTIEIPGSDHRGLVATVTIPPSSATA
jgi:endonuclease/exonuclease/phosphatase (EEP) superfamily protein YafD